MRTVPMIWAVLALSGCAVGPVFTPPEMALPDRYARLEPVSRASAADLQWWQHFNDPLLTRLVDGAVAGNLDLAQAQARLREAAAIARRDGNQLSGDADLTTTRVSNGGAEDSSLGLTARIGLAGESRWRAKAAAQRLEAAQFDTQAARRALLAELGIAYVDLRFAQASLVARGQDLTSRQQTLRDINRLLDAGAATQLDVLRAQALVTETQAQMPALSASVMRQRNRISTLLGQPVGTLPVDLGYPGAQPDPVMRTAAGVPADLLRARPDIRQAERLYAAALSDLGVAEAARYPSLSLRGIISAPVGGGENTQSLVAGLSLPLFNQPALAASVDAADARVSQAYLRWQRAVLGAVEEVENAQANLQASVAALSEAQRLVDLNRRALGLSRDLLSNRGTITVLDVLDRERALSEARALRARSQRDRAVDYIILQTVMGQGHESGAN
ncbi:efflux transporter outer membrane subunit [Yoonia sp.]|uniref:efflux transporter outer membrane subunit n=1 Tax=Yoonia sp. TaxID=2212373 RepID=UPI001A05C79D|nr:efflux transporter outer membrane subunit [Yoonia sp.]MBE0414351.1 efflux transporter outer membrane subunit [Yoonia sp.]